MRRSICLLLVSICCLYNIASLDAAVSHFLSELNYENPAALNRVKHEELIIGDHYWNLGFKFKGTSFTQFCSARTREYREQGSFFDLSWD